jgi:hypothetical protein
VEMPRAPDLMRQETPGRQEIRVRGKTRSLLRNRRRCVAQRVDLSRNRRHLVEADSDNAVRAPGSWGFAPAASWPRVTRITNSLSGLTRTSCP